VEETSKIKKLVTSRTFWVSLSPMFIVLLSRGLGYEIDTEMSISILVGVGGILAYLLYGDKLKNDQTIEKMRIDSDMKMVCINKEVAQSQKKIKYEN